MQVLLLVVHVLALDILILNKTLNLEVLTIDVALSSLELHFD